MLIGLAVPSLTNMSGPAHWIGPVIGGAVGLLVPMIAPAREWFSVRAADRREADLAGANDTPISGRNLKSLGVHQTSRDGEDKEFAPRDQFPVVRKLLADQEPVLIEGESMSGKTRLAVEVLRDGWGQAPLWFLSGNGAIKAIIGGGQDAGQGSVIFLDDVDEFLSDSSLTVPLLDRWLTSGCTVVATITASKYADWRKGMTTHLPGWEVINRFHRVHLDPKPTENELAAMRETGYADLISQAREFGLPAFLGGAPLARDMFRQGAEERSWGWALVRAASDWRRVGLGPAASEQLQELALRYPDRPPAEPDWGAAWEWAQTPFNLTVALLRLVAPDRWEVLDVITEEARGPINADVLHGMNMPDLTPAQSLSLGSYAFRRDYADTGRSYEGDSWIEALIAQGLTAENSNVNTTAALVLGALLGDSGREPRRAGELIAKALKQAPNDPIVLAVNAHWHDKNGHPDRAEQMYERAIAADPTDARILGNYANFLTDVRRDHDRAEQMYERAIAADPAHANNLGNYAGFCFTQHRDEVGEEFAIEALRLAIGEDELPLRAECSFYLFAHCPTRRIDAGVELKTLLGKGISTGAWNFMNHIKRVWRDDPTRAEMCEAVAAALAVGEDAGLDRFPEWRDLPGGK